MISSYLWKRVTNYLHVLIRAQITRHVNASWKSTDSSLYFFKEAYTFILDKKIMQSSLLLEQISFLCHILRPTNTQSAKHGHWRYCSGCISQLEWLVENLLPNCRPKWCSLLAGFHLLPEAGKLLSVVHGNRLWIALRSSGIQKSNWHLKLY